MHAAEGICSCRPHRFFLHLNTRPGRERSSSAATVGQRDASPGDAPDTGPSERQFPWWHPRTSTMSDRR
jgi:hypothetical protein